MSEHSTAYAPIGTPVVEARNITKSFPGVVALSDVDLTLAAGEIHALVGENGAGKSSLIKILSGNYAADEGELLVDGLPMEATVAGARGAGVATIHQEHQLFLNQTVAENIVVPRWSRAGGFVRNSELEGRARAALDPLVTGLDLKASARTLSPGVGQLVEVARGLSQNARVLILDEPTTALADRERERLFQVLDNLRKEGMAILYVSHNLEEVRRLSDRVTVFRNGRKVATGPMDDYDTAALVRHMVGHEVDGRSSRNSVLGDVALEVDGLSRGVAVRGVSFSVREGEVFALVGLEGSGRTEIARCLFGVDRADSGRVLVEGRELRLGHPADAIEAGIGMVPEERKLEGLFPTLSVRENISISLFDLISRFGVVRSKSDRQLAQRSVKALDIRTPSTETAIGTLSGGNQQKTILARWITRDCKILILDEPTKGIDIGAKAEIYALIKELAAKGTAIVLISSDLDECLPAANRFGVMKAGELIQELDADEASKEKIISLATGDREGIQR